MEQGEWVKTPAVTKQRFDPSKLGGSSTMSNEPPTLGGRRHRPRKNNSIDGRTSGDNTPVSGNSGRNTPVSSNNIFDLLNDGNEIEPR